MAAGVVQDLIGDRDAGAFRRDQHPRGQVERNGHTCEKRQRDQDDPDARHVDGEVCGEPGCDAAQDPSAGWPAEKPRLLLALIRPDVYDGVPSFAALRASLSMRVYGCFLEHFEQFEHARERLPGAGAGAGAGAVGAYLSLKPSARSPVDIEEKANRLPRRW